MPFTPSVTRANRLARRFRLPGYNVRLGCQVWFALVLFASIYALVRLIVSSVELRRRSAAELQLEVLALRHEVAVLRRHVKRPDLLPTDRLILAAVGRHLRAGRLMFSPATLLRWHHELVRRKWATFQRRPRRGRPPIDEATQALILEMARESRRLLWADCTANPDSDWVTQQARNLAYELSDLAVPVRFAIPDRDNKFTSGFDAVLKSEAIKVIRTPFRAPRANSRCVRAIGSARREFFDFTIVTGERHLRLLLDLWLDHYNRGRPHMALDLLAPDPRPLAATGRIVRERKLFGLTTEYSRAA